MTNKKTEIKRHKWELYGGFAYYDKRRDRRVSLTYFYCPMCKKIMRFKLAEKGSV